MEEGKNHANNEKKEEVAKAGGNDKVPAADPVSSSPIHLVGPSEQDKWAEFRIATKLPERRSYMCSCVYKNQLYVYGGIDIQEGPRDSLYRIELESDAPQWANEQLKDCSLERHSNGASVLSGSKWCIIGGVVNADQSADVCVIDLETLGCEKRPAKSAQGNVPQPIDSHTAVLTAPDKALVFGGYIGGKRCSKLYEYSISSNTWREIGCKGPRPEARAGHSAIFYDNAMYVFGGTGEDSERRNDLWKFEIVSETWTEIVKKEGDVSWPQPRTGHSALLNGDIMYVFGGNLGLARETNDLLGFDLKSLSWSTVSSGGKLLNAEERQRLAKERKEGPRKISMDMSSKSKGARYELAKRGTDPRLDSPKSPKRAEGSPRLSPEGSPKQRTAKRSDFAADYDKQREEVKTPIVLAMNNSVVMKATVSTKRRPGEAAIEEKIVKGRVIGNFPCGRDGCAAQVCGGKIYVFGGDRYQMAYNDLYEYSL